MNVISARTPEFFIVPTILRPIKFKDGEELFKELQYRRLKKNHVKMGIEDPKIRFKRFFFSLSKHRFSIMKLRQKKRYVID